MKALVLSTSYPVRRGSLDGSFVRDLLLALSSEGWEFEVVTPRDPAFGERQRDAGVVVREAPHWGSSPRGLAHARGIPEALSADPWKWVLAPALVSGIAREASRALRRERPDAIWSHWLIPSGVVGAVLARRSGIRHVATAHGADVHLLERLVRIPGMRRALHGVFRHTRIVAPVAHTARRVEAALDFRDVAVCPLAAGATQLSRVHEPLAAARPPAALRLLYLGRFEPIKGPDLLLDACSLSGRHTSSDVTLAGSGSLERRLRERAAALGLKARFPGVLHGDAKSAAIAGVDALVLPSRTLPGGRSEGFPHAAMEAFASGTPVIAPEGGALGEWIHSSGAGLAYRPAAGDREHASALASELVRLALAPGLIEALRARASSAGRAFSRSRAAGLWSAALLEGVRA